MPDKAAKPALLHTNVWDHEYSIAANTHIAAATGSATQSVGIGEEGERAPLQGVPGGYLSVTTVVAGGAEATEASVASDMTAETSFRGGGGGISRGSRKGSLTLRGFDADETTMEI